VISANERDRLLAPFAGRAKIALAVSGGADSMALMLLFARWRAGLPGGAPAIHVFTVDHGLRAASGAEAEQVARWAAALKLIHHTLRWQGEKPGRNVQALARRARYRLLAEACHGAGIGVLVTAHHLEDQAETLLLRLARGSGVDGLAAMAHQGELFGLTIARPLLDMPRARLRASLKDAGQDWIEDPSNDDARYARVRMRALSAALGAEGLSPRRLADTARQMRRARAALDAAADELAARAGRLDAAGYCTLELAPFLAAPEETGLRLLARILMAVGGQGYRPRLERLERLYRQLATGKGAATLAGCRILAEGGRALVWREAGRAAPLALSLEPGTSALWDGRFKVSASRRLRAPVEVRALGAEGWRDVRRSGPYPGMPGRVGPSCISFWRGGELLAAPHAMAPGGAGEPLRADFVGVIAGAGSGKNTQFPPGLTKS